MPDLFSIHFLGSIFGRRRYGRSQPNSAYTQFWLVRAMLELLAPPGRVSDGNRFYFELDGREGAGISSKIPEAVRTQHSSRKLSVALTRAAVSVFSSASRTLLSTIHTLAFHWRPFF